MLAMYALKRMICMLFALSITSLNPSVFFASVLEIASRHHDQLANGGKQSMYCLMSLIVCM